jgi:hypothetical protein
MIRIWRLSEEDAGASFVEEDPLLNGPALPGEGLEQSEIDDLIATDHGAHRGPAARDEIALEVETDLKMGTALALAEAPSPSKNAAEDNSAPAPVVALAPRAPSKLSARLREAIEALSPTERMALFS